MRATRTADERILQQFDNSTDAALQKFEVTFRRMVPYFVNTSRSRDSK